MLIVVALVAMLFGGIGVSRGANPPFYLGAWGGCVVFSTYPSDPDERPWVVFGAVEWRWRPWFWSDHRVTYFGVPLIYILVPWTLVTIILFRRDRRPPEGHCDLCGYNLAGNTSGTCPECGVSAQDTSQ